MSMQTPDKLTPMDGSFQNTEEEKPKKKKRKPRRNGQKRNDDLYQYARDDIDTLCHHNPKLRDTVASIRELLRQLDNNRTKHEHSIYTNNLYKPND